MTARGLNETQQAQWFSTSGNCLRCVVKFKMLLPHQLFKFCISTADCWVEYRSFTATPNGHSVPLKKCWVLNQLKRLKMFYGRNWYCKLKSPDSRKTLVPTPFTGFSPLEQILLLRKICWHSWCHTHDFPHSDSLSVWPHLAFCSILIQKAPLFPLLLTQPKKLDTNTESCVKCVELLSSWGESYSFGL